MYVDRPGSGGMKRSIKDRLGSTGVRSSRNSDQQEALKRQRQDNVKRNSVISDKRIDKKTLVRKVVPEALTTASVQKDLPGSTKAILNMSKSRVMTAGSVKMSDIAAMSKIRQTIPGQSGVSDIQAVSIAPPKELALSDTKVKSGAGLVSAKKPVIQFSSPLSTEQKQQSLVQAEELDVTSFLHYLGLSKYAITFKAEEVDMFALKHMNEGDLKEIGLPMGPRKKILIGLASAGVKK